MFETMKGIRCASGRIGWRGLAVASVLCAFASVGGAARADTVPA